MPLPSPAFALCFVNNVYVTAEIIYCTARAPHEAVAWSLVVCGRPVQLHLKSDRNYDYLTTVSAGSATGGENIARLLLQLLCQPGDRLHYVTVWLYYGYLMVLLGYVILWLLLRLLYQPGENKGVCSSYFSLHLLPAF